MHHVFVSYSRKDAEWVTALVRRLEGRGLTTWLDQRDIPLTLPWVEEIEDAVLAADLFLICDSAASRESTSCGAEARLAHDAAKRGIEVEVGSNVDRAAVEVAQAAARLPLDYRMRTELAVQARNWDRGGRERGSLVSARSRKRLMLGADVAPPLARHERSFLRESRSRSRRRTGVSVVVGLTIVLSVLTSSVLDVVGDRGAEINDEQAAIYLRTQAALRKGAEDPYQALGQTAALGDSEAAVGALIAQAGFEMSVPDDAFAVPAAARRFATPEVGDSVVVTDGTGRFWERAAAAREVREARPAEGPGAVAAGLSPGSLRARVLPGTGVVEVSRHGTLWRRIAFSRHPSVLRISPNGRELAAAGSGVVEIADLRLGEVRTTTSGASGTIRDLAWASDGRRLWGLGEKLVVSWPVRDGRVLVDEPDSRFEALLPAARDSAAWVVSRDGELRQIALGDGRVLARLEVPDEIHSGAGSPDGSVAALSGARGVWIVSLDGGPGPRLIPLPDCTPGRASFPDAESFYQPCLSGPVLRVSVERGDVLEKIGVGPAGAFAVRAVPRRKLLLVSDTFAHLFAVPAGGRARELFAASCGGSITRIAAAPNGGVVVPTGSGSGIVGCAGRGVLVGPDPASPSSWSFDAISNPVDTVLAEAAAVTDDGSAFAFGYSDGTVVMHPTVNISPQRTITTVNGEIRDMLMTSGDQLLVATAAGVVQRVPICARCLTNAAFAASARRLVHRGIEIGTAFWSGDQGQEQAQ